MKTYTVGIKLESKERYDNLMQNHSEKSLLGLSLDFEGLFQGYPEEDQYPCLVQYSVGGSPFGILGMQLSKIVEDGYKISINLES